MAGSLDGKRVLLGVTGGIAAYKAADLCSKLVQAGADVDVIMTEAATRFVAPLTFSALIGHPVSIDMWAAPGGEPIPHIQLASEADLVIVAPLSANTMAKLAYGLADDLLTATLLATTASLVLAPGMESHMWANPATQENVTTLRERGALFVGPGTGRLASGGMGTGRMAEPTEIMLAVRGLLARSGPLANWAVLVTAGGTREPLDPVRFLTNASSGKMGVALAEAARDLGATVTLVHAPLSVPLPSGVESVPVQTAIQMRDAVMDRLPETEILIGAAAVADYRPVEVAEQKIKKGADLVINLTRNPDILDEVAVRRRRTGQPRLVIGFAAETQDLLTNAAAKLRAKNMDIIVANDVTRPGSGFDADENCVTFLYPDGRQEPLPTLPKTEVAARVLAAACRIVAPE